MTDNTQPEALRLAEILEGDYCPDWFYEQGVDEVAAELRRQHTRIAELEAQIEALSGVQALSAAPAGWKLVPEDATEEMVRATDKVNFANADTDGTMHNVWNVMLAASPTPPAEQQAAPKAAPAVDDPNRWFTVVYRDISPGDEARLLAEHPKASVMSWSHAIRDRDAARAVLAKWAAPQQEAQGPVAYVHVPHSTVEGKVRPVVSFEKYQQDYADGIYSTRIPLYTAPQPAPAPLSDAQIAEMMRDTWGCASIAPRHALEFARAVERAHGIAQKGGD